MIGMLRTPGILVAVVPLWLGCGGARGPDPEPPDPDPVPLVAEPAPPPAAPTPIAVDPNRPPTPIAVDAPKPPPVDVVPPPPPTTNDTAAATELLPTDLVAVDDFKDVSSARIVRFAHLNPNVFQRKMISIKNNS